MKRLILLLMLILGFHGYKHSISHRFLSYKTYKEKKIKREKEFMDNLRASGL